MVALLVFVIGTLAEKNLLLDAKGLFGDNVIKNPARLYALLVTKLVRLRWLYIGQVRFFSFSFLSFFPFFYGLDQD